VWILWLVIAVAAVSIRGVPLAAAAGLLPRRAVLPPVLMGGLATLGWPVLILSRVNRRTAWAGLVCPECAASLLGTATQEAVTPARSR
jgi:hypothetical protein